LVEVGILLLAPGLSIANCRVFLVGPGSAHTPFTYRQSITHQPEVSKSRFSCGVTVSHRFRHRVQWQPRRDSPSWSATPCPPLASARQA